MPVVLHEELTPNKIVEARAEKARECREHNAKIQARIDAGETGLKLRKEGVYTLHDGDGLYLDVDHNKRKGDTHIWRAIVTVNGTRTKETFGPYPIIDIPTARKKLAESKKLLETQETGKQVNPSKVKREIERAVRAAAALVNENARLIAAGEAPVGTVWWWVKEVHKLEAPANKLRTSEAFMRTLTKDAKDTIGHMPIADVKRCHIEAICDAIRERCRKAGASKDGSHAVKDFRDAMRKVFNHAFDKGAIEAIPIVEPRLANRLEQIQSTPLPAVSTPDMLGMLLRWISSEENAHRPGARDAFMLSLLTGQRGDTVFNARWWNPAVGHGVNLETMEWHIPRWTVGTEKAERKRLAQRGVIEIGDDGERKHVHGAMKGKFLDPNDAPHVVPLSRQVCEALQRIMDNAIDAGTFCEFVFPSGRLELRHVKGMDHQQVDKMLRDGHKRGVIPKHVNHGNRAIMRTLMTDPDIGLGDSFDWTNEDGKTVQVDTHLALEVQFDHTHGKAMQQKTAGMAGVYYRGDMLKQRRVVVQAWSDLVERIIARKPAHEVAVGSRLTPRQRAALATLTKTAPTFLVAAA